MDRYYDEDGYIHYGGYTFADDEDDYLQYLESEDAYLRGGSETPKQYSEDFDGDQPWEEESRERKKAFESVETWNKYINNSYKTHEEYDEYAFDTFWYLVRFGGLGDLEPGRPDDELIEYCKRVITSWENSRGKSSADLYLKGRVETEDLFFEDSYPEFLRKEKRELFHKWIFQGKLPEFEDEESRDYPF